MNAIVAVDRNWGIGKDGKLLFHIPEDMKFFKEITTGKIVVMGRKTLDSLPEGKPLKNRINLVITRNKNDCKFYDNTLYGDINEIKDIIETYDTNNIFIIGGESIYKQFINECDTVYVTRVDEEYEADTFMPNLIANGFISEDIINVGKNKNGKRWSIEKWINNYI